LAALQDLRKTLEAQPRSDVWKEGETQSESPHFHFTDLICCRKKEYRNIARLSVTTSQREKEGWEDKAETELRS